MWGAGHGTSIFCCVPTVPPSTSALTLLVPGGAPAPAQAGGEEEEGHMQTRALPMEHGGTAPPRAPPPGHGPIPPSQGAVPAGRRQQEPSGQLCQPQSPWLAPRPALGTAARPHRAPCPGPAGLPRHRVQPGRRIKLLRTLLCLLRFLSLLAQCPRGPEAAPRPHPRWLPRPGAGNGQGANSALSR